MNPNHPTSTPEAAPATPHDLMQRLTAHLAARDLDRLIALYEPDAVFVAAPGAVHTGHSAVRSALAELLAVAPALETHITGIHEVGPIALATVAWSMRVPGPDGTTVAQSGVSADVLRRQADGSWRVLIDHP